MAWEKLGAVVNHVGDGQLRNRDAAEGGLEVDNTTESATDAFTSAFLANMMVGGTKGAGDHEVRDKDRHHLPALPGSLVAATPGLSCTPSRGHDRAGGGSLGGRLR